MQVLVRDGYAYVGTLAPGEGTEILDVRHPAHPRRVGTVPGWPGSFSPKVQIGDGLLLVNYEDRRGRADRVGLAVLELSNPAAPREIGFYSTGGRGVHRMWYTGGRYAYLSAVPEGEQRRLLIILDLADPSRPLEAGRWRPADAEPPGLSYGLHHPIVEAGVAYAGWWDLGVVLLDVSDPARVREIGRAGGWAGREGGHTHTALPLPQRQLMVVTDEAADLPGEEQRKFIRVFAIDEPQTPQLLARCPVPAGRWDGGGTRFGPHNLHENRPGTFISDRYVFATYFGAGLRVYDLQNPRAPQEVAAYVPDPDAVGPIPVNDLTVDEDGRVYLTDRRNGHFYIVQWVG